MKTCKDCGWCHGKNFCKDFKAEPEEYNGIRFTADGFDCALPVAIDSYSTCSFGCLYCFSNFLIRDPYRKGEYKIRALKLKVLDNFLSLDPKRVNARLGVMQNALRRPHGKRCPIQWGALGEPFDNIERWQGLALEMIKLFVKHKQPTRVSTKGGLLLQHKDYLDALSHPDIFWVAFSIISTDDAMLKRIDLGAPSSVDRFKAMKELSRRGVKTSLRFRPVIPGVSDRTDKKRKIWKELIDRAADSGAKAISMEFIFVPIVQPPHIRERIQAIENICGVPLTSFYKRTTAVKGSCLRGWKYWKEELVFAVRDHAKKNGLTFAISDPHWKELNDYGCCCGIPDDDPVFGSWERENATHMLVAAREKFLATGKRQRVHLDQVIPTWADKVYLREMACVTGARGQIAARFMTWAAYLKGQWNNYKKYRSPLHYFGDVLLPVGIDHGGNRVYEYVERSRKNLKFGWDV